MTARTKTDDSTTYLSAMAQSSPPRGFSVCRRPEYHVGLCLRDRTVLNRRTAERHHRVENERQGWRFKNAQRSIGDGSQTPRQSVRNVTYLSSVHNNDVKQNYLVISSEVIRRTGAYRVQLQSASAIGCPARSTHNRIVDTLSSNGRHR